MSYGYNPADFKSDYGFMGDAIAGLGKFGAMAYDAHEIQQQLDNDAEKLDEYKKGREEMYGYASKNDKIQNAFVKANGGVDNTMSIAEQYGIVNKNDTGNYVYTDNEYVDDGVDIVEKSVQEIRSPFVYGQDGNQNISPELLEKILHKKFMGTIPEEMIKGTDKNKLAVRKQSSYADEAAFNFSMLMEPIAKEDKSIYTQIADMVNIGSADSKQREMYRNGVSEYKSEREFNTFVEKIDNNGFSTEVESSIPFKGTKDGGVKQTPKYDVPDVPWKRMEYMNSNGLPNNKKAVERNKIEDAKYNNKIGVVFNDMLSDMNSVAIDKAYADLSQADQGMSKEFWNSENVSRMISLTREYDPVAELEKKGMGEHLEYMRQTDPNGYKTFIDRTKEKRNDMVNVWRVSLHGKTKVVGGGNGGATPKKLSYYYEKMSSNQNGITATKRGKLSELQSQLKVADKDDKGGILQQIELLKTSISFSTSLENAYSGGAVKAHQLESFGTVDTSTTGVSDDDVSTFQLDAVSSTLKGMTKNFDGNLKNTKNNDEIISSLQGLSEGAPVGFEKKSIGEGKTGREMYTVYHDANDDGKFNEGERVLGEPGKSQYDAYKKKEDDKNAKVAKQEAIDALYSSVLKGVMRSYNGRLLKEDINNSTSFKKKLADELKIEEPTATEEQINKVVERMYYDISTDNSYLKDVEKKKKRDSKATTKLGASLDLSGSGTNTGSRYKLGRKTPFN